jgi:hypothetical protein
MTDKFFNPQSIENARSAGSPSINKCLRKKAAFDSGLFLTAY